MARRIYTYTAWPLVLLLCVGCREDPPLPPEAKRESKPVVEVDEHHVAHVRADRLITVPNLVFAVQHDRAYSSQMGLTLKTTQPGGDGSRLLFYKFEPASTLEKLAQSEIYLIGGRHYDRNGPGIFTTTSVYQPKFATMKITAHTENEVRGTLTGEFYKFNPRRPMLRPDVIDVDMTFVAALIIK